MRTRDDVRRRRYLGLTALCVGLVGLFASLTLTALGRGGPALVVAGAGGIVALLGLWWLPPPT